MAAVTGRDDLRRRMRALRRALANDTRRKATASFARVTAQAHLLRPGMRIAVYVPHGAEADPGAIARLAHRCSCEVYLPVIVSYRRREMLFVHYRSGAQLVTNRYGILEPLRRGPRVSIRSLDVVFLPLLAVDDAGSRLGSGQGYYDRALHRLRGRRGWRRPLLVGIAYELQRVAHLAAERWDIPLDALVTERAYYIMRHQPRGIA